uniref:Replication factor A C-terminal domain-containing protein n=1 Tax=Amphimedon queenslandica TaxID=400682 RepID=A0A1X7T717_AMPQE
MLVKPIVFIVMSMFRIGEGMSTCKLVLWQDNVDKLVVGDSYVFSNLRIKKFTDAQFLLFTVDTTWNTVDNIGEVYIRQADENPQYNQLTISGEVVSITYDQHHKCPVCDWKVSMAVPPDIVKCSNCEV